MTDAATPRAAIDAALAGAGEYPEGHSSGRGIVIAAGGARLFTCAWVAIRVLQDIHHCRLPIEVWHLGPRELGAPMVALLESRGVRVVDALEVAKRHPMRNLGGWELKPYALRHSRFEEVLLLDADNVPVLDPEFLFDTPQYREHGTILWPDRVRIAESCGIWELCGLRWRDEPAVESGQLLVDKRRSWRALAVTLHLNENSDLYYQYVYGDKDTFYLGWRLADQRYAMPAHAPIRLPAVLCQRDFDGRVVFQHRNHDKWMLAGHNRRIEGFELEDECFDILGELAQEWDGRIFHPPEGPERSAGARALEKELCAQRRFRETQVSLGETDVELRPGHRIHGGQDAVWHVEQRDGVFELVVGAGGRERARLVRDEDGVWCGRRLRDSRAPMELRRRDDAPPEPTPSMARQRAFRRLRYDPV